MPPLFINLYVKCSFSAFIAALFLVVRVLLNACAPTLSAPHAPVCKTQGHQEEGQGANCPKASRSKGSHKTQFFKAWGAHKVNQQ